MSDYEGIQQTIARNNIALDDRRFEDCIATYTPDGTIAGHTGHDAIRAFILSQDLAVRDVPPSPRPGEHPHVHDQPRPSVAAHLDGLRRAGFGDVAVPWSAFVTALLMARRAG